MSNSNQTEKVLQKMFTENTGKHLCDSGGAYGRHWEKNQGVNFENTPFGSTEFWARNNELDLCITKSSYHFLNENLEYDEEMGQKLKDFIETYDENASWHEVSQAFAEEMHDDSGDFNEPNIVNTYNHESLLDQVLEYRVFHYENDDYVVLQIHQGCDVRGGYTKPQVFSCGSEGWYGIADDVYGYIGCSECDASWHTDDAYNWHFGDGFNQKLNDIEAIEVEELKLDGSITGKVQVSDHKASCPECGQGEIVYG